MMFWIIATIILGCIAVISLVYNGTKNKQIDQLEYEVSYLLSIVFDGQTPNRNLTNEEKRKIKKAWDNRLK